MAYLCAVVTVCAPLPMEPIVPMSVPIPPVGFQLVRDPTTGGLLLLPTSEPLQQAVVWPSYTQPSSHLLLPQLPPPPLQLLSSASTSELNNFMQTSTTLHQHTQTHSTRLVAVTTDSKRKIPLPLPATTLIKIETDATVDHTKTLQAVSTVATNTATVFTDQTAVQPLLAAHLIYQHPTTNLILSQTPTTTTTVQPTLETTSCRSQATSPVTCLTPPPENTQHQLTHHQNQQQEHEEETTQVQDASNQTDTVEDEIDECVKKVNENNGVMEDKCDDTTRKKEIVAPISLLNQIKENKMNLINESVDLKPSDLRIKGLIKEGEDAKLVGEEENVKNLPLDLQVKVNVECNEDVSSEQTKPLDFRMNFKSNIEENESSQKLSDEISEKPDTTGLDLLSSLVDIENRRNIENNNNIKEVEKKVDDKFGGLNLLCALAEQRILEEVSEQKRRQRAIEKSERKKEKRKSRGNRDPDEPKHKKSKYYINEKGEKIKKIKDKIDKEKDDVKNCNYCNLKDFRSYKSEEKAKKFVASKTQTLFEKGDFPCMNANELNMRKKLADLQRKYREKQQELVKLKSKKHSNHHKECSKKHHKSRKKCSDDKIKINDENKIGDDKIRDRLSPPPPILDKIDHHNEQRIINNDLLKPPTLCAITDEKNYENIQDINENNNKRCFTPDLSDSSPEKASSKKRKVGRPKKLLPSSNLSTTTETLVAKKAKKCYAIGYLLAAKQRLLENSTFSDTPPRFIEESNENKKEKKQKKVEKCKIRPKLKAEPTIKSYREDDDDDDEIEGDDDEDDEIGDDDDKDKENDYFEKVKEEKLSQERCAQKFKDEKFKEEKFKQDKVKQGILKEERFKEEKVKEKFKGDKFKENKFSEDIVRDDKLSQEKLKRDKLSQEKLNQEKLNHENIGENPQESVKNEKKEIDDRCLLKPDDLDKKRVLTAMGGLFYAGELKAIEPPDVYSITLDGERGNRPHIMPREDILRDAILEVHPRNEEELTVGTRVVAYWSQKYRCLYPGSVAEPDSPTSKFISVDFDDGDNGKIPLKDIRLLPPDYPFMEYDPNPLSSLSKRKRRTSTTEDSSRKNSTNSTNTESTIQDHYEIQESHQTDSSTFNNVNNGKDKKKMKKKKREKLRRELENQEIKKKKRKHRCTEENCQHKNRKHKKHKKHKKHHHKEEKSDDKNIEIIKINSDQIDFDSKKSLEKIDPKEINQEKDVNDEDDFNEEFEDEEDDVIGNPEDEVTMEDIEDTLDERQRGFRNRQASCESRSKMSAFLPDSNLWSWLGEGRTYKFRGKKKIHYKSIQRGKEVITLGDAAVFLSTGSPDRPYIGIIEKLWEICGNMKSRVRWYYHPEEATGYDIKFQIPGALLESNHQDENDVQTICRKCDVLQLDQFQKRLNHDNELYAKVYENQDLYYLAGYYDPSLVQLTVAENTPIVKCLALKDAQK
ncbi:golgin subfamily A member 6-like protein 22 isoform X2 [Onthophagus taurus]|uniref:golgin subfamily A member 6-like protein 22 isoform X2 n=1 Tax=Onthophagus taurus TaxID=166361 RepID=UPI000C2067A5|nr:FK506-binding protein 5-like isoform X2 [Onthophagus taurus]